VNVLVLTSEPVSADDLRTALGARRDGARTDAEWTEVMILAPAFQDNPVKFWLSDADDAIARAQQVSSETLANLDDAGIAATADTGESDPFDAIQDALRTFAADRVVIFTHPEGDAQYREDIDPAEVERRFGLPVDRATVSA
jgi:hypothetical protein